MERMGPMNRGSAPLPEREEPPASRWGSLRSVSGRRFTRDGKEGVNAWLRCSRGSVRLVQGKDRVLRALEIPCTLHAAKQGGVKLPALDEPSKGLQSHNADIPRGRDHRAILQDFVDATKLADSSYPPLSAEQEEAIEALFEQIEGVSWDRANPCLLIVEEDDTRETLSHNSPQEAVEHLLRLCELGEASLEQLEKIQASFAPPEEADQVKERQERIRQLEEKFGAFCLRHKVTATGTFACAIDGTQILKGKTRLELLRNLVEALKDKRPDQASEIEQSGKEIAELLASYAVGELPLNPSILSFEVPLPLPTITGEDGPRGVVRSDEEWDQIWPPEWEDRLDAVAAFLEELGIQFSWKREQLSTLTGRWTFEWGFPEEWTGATAGAFTQMKVENFEELFEHLNTYLEGILGELKNYYLKKIDQEGRPLLRQLPQQHQVAEPNVQTQAPSRRRTQLLAVISVIGLAAIAIGMRQYLLGRQLPGIAVGKRYV